MFEFQTLSPEQTLNFFFCVGHEQAVGARCTIVYIYMEWKSSLNLLPREIKEEKRKCRECFSFTPRALLQLQYKLWITTLAKYILIQFKNIWDKTLANKVERRLIVEIKWTITFAKSFICSAFFQTHHTIYGQSSRISLVWRPFEVIQNIILELTVSKTYRYQWGEG